MKFAHLINSSLGAMLQGILQSIATPNNSVEDKYAKITSENGRN